MFVCMFDRLFDQPLSDIQLIEKAKENHRDFARLYDRFVHVVYRFVRWHVASEHDAEDIVSETFMAVAMRINQYDTTREQKFTTWLLGIAKYKLADHRRSVYKKPEVHMDESFDPGYETDMVELLTHQELYDRILACASHLPPQQGSMFFLRYVEELTNKEIAALCELDEKTVSCTLSIVTKKLRKQCLL